jgi:hypothetical protein
VKTNPGGGCHLQITYARDVETEVELEDIAGEGRHRREYEHDATRNKAIYGWVLKAKTEIEK